MLYKYWVSTGLPFKVCSVCLIHYGLGLYLSVSWCSLFVRLCPCFFIIAIKIYYIDCTYIQLLMLWDIYGTACLSFLCHCLLSVKLCINACICHLTSYSVVQLHGLRLPSITGLYDRARPGTGNHPSWPQQVLHGGKRPASPSA